MRSAGLSAAAGQALGANGLAVDGEETVARGQLFLLFHLDQHLTDGSLGNETRCLKQLLVLDSRALLGLLPCFLLGELGDVVVVSLLGDLVGEAGLEESLIDRSHLEGGDGSKCSDNKSHL